MLRSKRLMVPVAVSMAVLLVGCSPPAPPASPQPSAAQPSPAVTLTPSPAVVPAPVSPKPSPAAATPKPASPKPASPKPSPSPTADIAQIKRQLESDMRGLYDAVHSFTGGAYRLVSPTAEQEKSKVPWKSAHRVQFSFAGEIYFFSTAADYIATAQKSIENAYSMTTTQSSNVTDEALVQGVSAELRKAWSDCNLQNVLTYMYEKSQSETIRKWETAPGTGRALKEADRDSGIASLASWYASYRKELADLRSKINRITSYSGKAATPTPTPTRKS